MTISAANTTAPQPAVRPRWWANWWWLPLLLVLAAPILQLPRVVCACYKGEAKGDALLIADVAIGIRALVAVIRRERGLSWIVYVALYIALVPLTLKIAGEL